MRRDSFGNPITNASASAIARFEQVATGFHAYREDPIAGLDAILADEPDFLLAHAVRAGIIATSTDAAFSGELHASLAAAEALAHHATAREHCYIAAARAWADGDYARAVEAWGEAAILAPRDLLAVQLGQLGDFLCGNTQMLRDRVARVLPAWDAEMPNYGYLLGMHAFGLEECGDYARAEDAGRAALAFDPADGWAAHAVAHVMEMQGRHEDGEAWLATTAKDWVKGGLFAYHNWWHLALFRLERGDTAGALRLWDESIASGGFGQAMELVDGTALLWRIATLGHDVGDRFARVAEGWRGRIGDAWYAFNDWHAMMAFVGAGDVMAQRALLGGAERAAQAGGTNGLMTRQVGLPLCRGVMAFGAGDYAAAVGHMLPVRGIAHRMGGSHAQRDAISWTLVEAAIRSGERPMAEALLAERTAAKPHSPVNLRWARRVAAMAPMALAA